MNPEDSMTNPTPEAASQEVLHLALMRDRLFAPKVGQQCIFDALGGWPYQQETAKKKLSLEGIYTVAKVEVRSAHTRVWLVASGDGPDDWFNACLFRPGPQVAARSLSAAPSEPALLPGRAALCADGCAEAALGGRVCKWVCAVATIPPMALSAAAPSEGASRDSLHAAIMNIPCKVPAGYPFGSDLCAGVYRQGHRDARHAAAELVSAQEGGAPDSLGVGGRSE